MFAMVVLAPGLIVGVIAWGVVGILRQRGREEFTQATAAALYARVMVVAGLLAALTGGAVVVKLLLSQIDPSFSYFDAGQVGVGMPGIHDQQVQDVILAAMLIGIGTLVASGHAVLARFVGGLRGGAPAWIVQGTSIVLTVLTGLAAFLALIVGGDQVLVHFLVSSQSTQFGDPVGAAVVFVPAWSVLMTLLVRRLRGTRRAPAGTTMAPA